MLYPIIFLMLGPRVFMLLTCLYLSFCMFYNLFMVGGNQSSFFSPCHTVSIEIRKVA